MNTPEKKPNSVHAIQRRILERAQQRMVPEPRFTLKDLEDLVNEAQASTKAPKELIWSSLLGAITTVCQHFVDVEHWKHRSVQPVSLFFLTLAESGERKTTCDNLFLSSLSQWEAEQRVVYEDAKKRYKISLECWQVKVKGMKAKLARCVKNSDHEGETDVEAQLSDLKNKEPMAPKRMTLRMQGGTENGLLRKLSDHLPTAGLVDAEGGQVLMAGTMKNTLTLNKLWDGDPIQINRHHESQSVILENARLSISLMLQPAIFKKYLDRNNSLETENGFLARCLFVEVESTQGTRIETYDDREVVTPCLNLFHERFQRMLKLISEQNENGVVHPERRVLRLSEESKRMMTDFFNEIERQNGRGKRFERISGAASKVTDHALRLAAVLHCWCEDFTSEEVSLTYTEYAIDIVRRYIDNYWKYFHVLHPAEQIEQDAERLYSWMCERSYKFGGPLLKSYIQQHAPNGMRRNEKLKPLLDDLLSKGRIEYTFYSNSKTIYISLIELITIPQNCSHAILRPENLVPAINAGWVNSANRAASFSQAPDLSKFNRNI